MIIGKHSGERVKCIAIVVFVFLSDLGRTHTHTHTHSSLTHTHTHTHTHSHSHTHTHTHTRTHTPHSLTHTHSLHAVRHHVDLVRAPEHPDREGDYIIEDCSDSYRAWKVLESGRGQLCWDWNLRTIRRIHYHKNVEKLEIEAGRYVCNKSTVLRMYVYTCMCKCVLWSLILK